MLNSLIISHCPELAVTEDIRRFSNLMTLELYNSTVIDWPSSASLSLPYFPSLVTLFIVRSRFVGGIPEGLTTDLSPNIVDVELVASDLGGPLPDDLDDKWSSIQMFYIEHSQLQAFPSVAAKTHLSDLSLAGNNISVIPEDVTLSDSAMYIMLDRNPLTRIPDSFGSLPELYFLTFQYTNVTELPQWLQARLAEDAAINIRAFETPYCRGLSPESVEAAVAWCSTADFSDGIFPLATKDALRAIHD